MELHSLLGRHLGSPEVDALVVEASKKKHITSTPTPTVKVFKDAVYHSYPSLGISFNYEPSQPLVPTAYSKSTPDPPSLTLVAIHLYKSPADKFETFPLSFVIPKKAEPSATTVVLVEMDMEKKGHEVVQLLGEPEEKQGGGRKGNCWVGYGKSTGVSMDFAGSNWEDRDMVLSCLTIALPSSTFFA
ncbi:hypothetical protein BGW39_000016 [Mortierella sp. 14UC]|nr:hypothetical protein BGW39_000016 [Mortierella sp. 14UC]